MNTSITFPPFAPKLQLPRRAPEITSADLAAQSRRLQDETTALWERKEQLFGEVAQLQAMRAESETEATSVSPSQLSESSDTGAPFFHRPGSAAPVHSEMALQSGWDQLKRARALLEAEQRELRDQRISVRDLEGQVARREAALGAREAAVTRREACVAAAEQARTQVEDSAMKRLTRAPFDMARSVFGAGNK